MSSRPPLILVLEALQRIGVTDPIRCVGGGMAAIACVQGEGRYADRERFPYPTLIITDLEMSTGDGYALLLHLRNRPNKQNWHSRGVQFVGRREAHRPGQRIRRERLHRWFSRVTSTGC